MALVVAVKMQYLRKKKVRFPATWACTTVLRPLLGRRSVPSAALLLRGAAGASAASKTAS